MSVSKIKVECISSKKCARLLEGVLSEQEAELIARHVDSCEECQSKMEVQSAPAFDTSLTPAQRKAWSAALARRGTNNAIDSVVNNSTDSFAHLATAQLRKPEPPSMPLPSIPGYEVYESLAVGGMGIVYRARHVRLQRDVAIKVLRSASRNVDELRFKREMAAVGKLRHRNIVLAHDAGEACGSPYIVMELLTGRDLSCCIRSEQHFSV